MSIARANFLSEIGALVEAVSMHNIGSASQLSIDPGVAVLRRGAAITGQVMLESFVRQRIEEVLVELQNWPAEFEKFPKKFRDKATIEALPHIEKYAKMIRGQNLDYETEIISEIKKMASISPPAYQFTKFIAGDYTGNLSATSIKDILSVFQVKDCWRTMHSLSSDVGFGVPSVEQVLRSIVINRHRSAHVAGYSPSATDNFELPQNLRLIGICVDTALSTSIQVALSEWEKWVSDDFKWLLSLEIYFVSPVSGRFRLKKQGALKAIRILDDSLGAKSSLPKKKLGRARLVVHLGEDGRPFSWDIA